MKLSICIPTFNRANHLADCLNSLIISKQNTKNDFEICVSDNNSTDNTEKVVKNAQKKVLIKYIKNNSNIGFPGNCIKVVEMASGEFVWIIGDDDLILPDAINKVLHLIKNNSNIDFFYLNSFHLDKNYLDKYPRPFDTNNLPHGMEPFSKYKKDGQLPFLKLIDPKISFDFLGGIFLYAFKRENWIKNIDNLSLESINDLRRFSSFENTFPHVKIISKAFKHSMAYFNSDPLSVNLSGVREWAAMSPLVMSIRLSEGLGEYRKHGLPLAKYIIARNFALNNFFSDYIKLVFHRKNSGGIYINLIKVLMHNCLYPNFYFSAIYFFARKLKKLITSLVHKFSTN